MRKTLRSAAERTQIVTRDELRPGDEPLSFIDAQQAAAYLRRHASEPADQAALRAALDADGQDPGTAPTRPASLIDQVARRIVHGRLRIVGRARRAYAPTVATPEAEAPEVAPTPPPAPPRLDTHWVKFRLTDEVTGGPLANISLRVRLPDARVVSATSNADGVVMFTGLTAGACKVEQIGDSEALEVVKLQ